MFKKFISKINIIDVLIIIAAVTVLSSLSYKIITRKSDINNKEYIIKSVCTSAAEPISVIIESKPDCFLYETQKPFGKISSVKYSESSGNAIEIDFSVSAKKSAHGILIGGTQILIGKHISLVANDAVFTVLINGIYPGE